jgi:hypothetical protein
MQLDLLAIALQSALVEAVPRTLLRHADDPVYGYGLFTSSGYAYVSDCVFTENGLLKVVARYQEKKFYPSHEEAMRKLRWSPCDSPFQLENGEVFRRCSGILYRIWEEALLLSDEEGDRIFRDIHEVFISAICMARNSWSFPKGCIFSLFAGDQSDAARLVNAERINSTELCIRFQAELDYVEPRRLAALRANRWAPDVGYEA